MLIPAAWWFAALAFACMGWNVIAVIRSERRLRRVYALDRLLTDLCAKAYVLQHAPIWQAWSAVMGSYTVEMTVRRRMPGSDTQ